MDSGPSRAGFPQILHVDMDAFYASVESLDNPTLAGRPLIVGGIGPRSVVASCSYEARVYGVRSAMPASQARRLCPQATFVAGRYDRYSELSLDIHAIFRDYTPVVEGISLDEAFLDVTGATRLFGPAVTIAEQIRFRVEKELGLSCSVGVSAVKFIAKLASEAAKPSAGRNGITSGTGVWEVAAGSEMAFLHPLPIEALWGVGPATSAKLRQLGITTIGELARVPAVSLESAVGRASGSHLARLARAEDDRAVEPDRGVKSISHEETYATDRRDVAELHIQIVRMSDAVAARVRRAGLIGRTVTLKVRYGDFTTLSRSRTIPEGVAEGPAIADTASGLLDSLDLSLGVRLLGVGVTNLDAEGSRPAEQLSLALGDPVRRSDVAARPAGSGRRLISASAAVDAIRERFGSQSVGPAALLETGKGLRVKRQGDTQWGPVPPSRSDEREQ